MSLSSLSFSKKGNITVLVIFILLASALFSLLAITQITNLMIYGDSVNSYFRARYLAKAGLELAITEVNLRDPGFQLSPVNTGDDIVKNNITSGYDARSPGWQWQMSSRTSHMTGVELKPGDYLVIPLFMDNVTDHVRAVQPIQSLKFFDVINDGVNNIKFTIKEGKESEFLLGIFAFSGENRTIYDEGVKVWMGLNQYPLRDDGNNKIGELLARIKNASQVNESYFTIRNQGEGTAKLEVDWTNSKSVQLILRQTNIATQGYYGDTEVGLRATFDELPPMRSFGSTFISQS